MRLANLGALHLALLGIGQVLIVLPPFLSALLNLLKLLLQPPRPLQPFFFDFSIDFLGLLLNEGFPGLFEAIV